MMLALACPTRGSGGLVGETCSLSRTARIGGTPCAFWEVPQFSHACCCHFIGVAVFRQAPHADVAQRLAEKSLSLALVMNRRMCEGSGRPGLKHQDCAHVGIIVRQIRGTMRLSIHEPPLISLEKPASPYLSSRGRPHINSPELRNLPRLAACALSHIGTDYCVEASLNRAYQMQKCHLIFYELLAVHNKPLQKLFAFNLNVSDL